MSKLAQYLSTVVTILVPYVKQSRHVNIADSSDQDLAWTGWKDSGKGQTLSKFGFDQFVKLKSYHIKDYPK